MTIPPKLAHLARLYGVQTSYRDMRKLKKDASVESLLAVLKALGAEVRSVDDVDRALIQRRRDLWERLAEPVVVAWDGKIPPIYVRSPENVTGLLRYSLSVENGVTQSQETPLTKLLLRDQQEVGGTHYVARELAIGRPLPVGYHRLDLEIGSRKHRMMLISAPMKAYFPFQQKVWGVFAPIYSLHSKRNPNAGDLTDFETLIDWMSVRGGRVAATLPLLAAFLDEPFEPSPYSPASRLFWNEFYLGGPHAARNKSGLVDYRKEMKLRRSDLEKEAAAFFKSSQAEGRDRYERFASSEKQLGEYAQFRAVTEKQGKGWTGWPARLQAGDIQKGDYSSEIHRYHSYVQWRLSERLQALSAKTKRNGQLLYLDLPLGLHPDSYDIWRYRDVFVREAAGGAPPDPIFTKGQNWGFPPLHPDAMRMHHHEYTIAYIRNHLRYARMLRIDHVMGLHRLFWIPEGLTGDKGAYVEYASDETYAILSVESHRYQAGIVGENLGTVPPEVNISMRRHNIQQMYVLQYEIAGSDAKRAVRSVPEDTVASLNTHDMPPFRAFLDGTDIDDRLDLKFLDASGARLEQRSRNEMRKSLVTFFQNKRWLKKGTRPTPQAVFKAASEFLASSMANVVLVNLEDLWGEVLPQNVPATQNQRPNWRRRMRFSLEEIEASEEAAEALRQVETGRRQRRS